MTVLELRFPVGQFHGTPWGRHVNEGAVEWPPSPWRILRALVATWHLKVPDITEARVRDLLHALAVPPVFHLPPATTGHTRHYMPSKNDARTKVFDAFVLLPKDAALLVAWDVTLEPEALEALRELTRHLGYLGRSESLVEARVLDGVTGIRVNAAPWTDPSPLPDGHTLARVLAAQNPSDYEAWRVRTLAESPEKPAPKKGRAGKKQAQTLPPDLLAALHADTGDLQAAGWNVPPGARFVNYSLPANALSVPPRPRHDRNVNPPLTPSLSPVADGRRWRGGASPREPGVPCVSDLSRSSLPTVARFALAGKVLPRITEAVSVANRIHESLCREDSDSRSVVPSVLTGVDDQGQPLRDHGHAHVFCETDGRDDRIRRVTLWAETGFDDASCRVLRKLHGVWGRQGHDVRLVFEAFGQPSDFQDSPLFRKAARWRSVTPFVATRHAKTFRDGRAKRDDAGVQIGSAEHDLGRLLALHARGAVATIRRLDERDFPYRFGQRRLRSMQFLTVRYRGGGSRGNQPGAAFVVEFQEPRFGPFALGYGAHFGLGLFEAVPDDNEPATT